MIIIGRPPNFDRILAAFPNAGDPGVIFAFGDNLYNPTNVTIPPALIAHEAVHQERQQLGAPHVFNTTPEIWWDRYLTSQDFRYREELLAHVAEYKAQLVGRCLDRNWRAKLLQSTAQRLIAPLYNYQPPRSMSVALKDLRQELDL